MGQRHGNNSHRSNSMEKMKERWIECQPAHICHAGPSHSDPPTMPRGPLQPPAHCWGGCRGGPPTGMIADKGLQDHTAFDISFVLLRHNKSCSGVLPKYKSVHGGHGRKVKEKDPWSNGKETLLSCSHLSCPFPHPMSERVFLKTLSLWRTPPPPLPACASWTLD